MSNNALQLFQTPPQGAPPSKPAEPLPWWVWMGLGAAAVAVLFKMQRTAEKSRRDAAYDLVDRDAMRITRARSLTAPAPQRPSGPPVRSTMYRPRCIDPDAPTERSAPPPPRRPAYSPLNPPGFDRETDLPSDRSPLSLAAYAADDDARAARPPRVAALDYPAPPLARDAPRRETGDEKLLRHWDADAEELHAGRWPYGDRS